MKKFRSRAGSIGLALVLALPMAAAVGAPRAQADTPGEVVVFDQLPQFGIYRSTEPDYTPPADVSMWTHGTEWAKKLSDADKAAIGADAKLKLTYHAQCDPYDRFGNLFYISVPKGTPVDATTPRTTFQDFITPFSDWRQGAKATYTFPQSNIAPFVRVLNDPARDIYIGIKGGSNPYTGDPCTNTSFPASYKEVGFKYSLSIVSTQAAPAASATSIVSFRSASEEKATPIIAGPKDIAGPQGAGTVALSIAGYGASSGGEEYSKTDVTVRVNGTVVGAFNTGIDCASYLQYSPRGNPGIFQNNLTTNPRSWCPGALVPLRYFPVTQVGGAPATIQLDLSRTGPYTSDSMYRTSLSLIK